MRSGPCFKLCHQINGAQFRSFSTGRPLKQLLKGQKLVFFEYGDPATVIRKENVQYSDDEQFELVKNNKTIVKMLASPLNPSDINTIQGTYPIKPKELPFVPGNEGVGVVLSVGEGNNPNGLNVNDWVIPRYPLATTWQSIVVAPNTHFMKIPKGMNLASAATLIVNPPTAYRMLKDFKKLHPGDTVIQNGGNSGVGQAVIQLCREFNLNCVSVVRGPSDPNTNKNAANSRSKEEFEALKKRLEVELFEGNTTNCFSRVITEEELSKSNSLENPLPKAQLALNCVGGRSGTDLLRTLDDRGIMVTYGGMSRQPVIAPTSTLIFKRVLLAGFWMTGWTGEHDTSPDSVFGPRKEMMDYLCELDVKGKWIPPSHKLIPLAKYREALHNCMKPFNSLKYILTFD